ncbi:hypothetical protein LuPra_01343 [Luteitalea pratensis]|uniref:Uncharacterized protein n=2 Tax=Luteitalea pratensis TaxID=1855912 RepID=A0A143PHY5_LUTPR|nr:hypothetical protein LuPra_01343 [Luteitalea pratensis]
MMRWTDRGVAFIQPASSPLGAWHLTTISPANPSIQVSGIRSSLLVDYERRIETESVLSVDVTRDEVRVAVSARITPTYEIWSIPNILAANR